MKFNIFFPVLPWSLLLGADYLPYLLAQYLNSWVIGQKSKTGGDIHNKSKKGEKGAKMKSYPLISAFLALVAQQSTALTVSSSTSQGGTIDQPINEGS